MTTSTRTRISLANQRCNQHHWRGFSFGGQSNQSCKGHLHTIRDIDINFVNTPLERSFPPVTFTNRVQRYQPHQSGRPHVCVHHHRKLYGIQGPHQLGKLHRHPILEKFPEAQSLPWHCPPSRRSTHWLLRRKSRDQRLREPNDHFRSRPALQDKIFTYWRIIFCFD